MRYARSYVPEDEQEKAIREMTTPRIISELNRKGSHVFYCGVNELGRGYTRKRELRSGAYIIISRKKWLK